MQDIEKKLRYFVIGEDKPLNNKKIKPCGHIGIVEVECTTQVEAENTVLNTNPPAQKPKEPDVIKANTYFGGILDSMKAKGITIVETHK